MGWVVSSFLASLRGRPSRSHIFSIPAWSPPHFLESLRVCIPHFWASLCARRSDCLASLRGGPLHFLASLCGRPLHFLTSLRGRPLIFWHPCVVVPSFFGIPARSFTYETPCIGIDLDGSRTFFHELICHWHIFMRIF